MAAAPAAIAVRAWVSFVLGQRAAAATLCVEVRVVMREQAMQKMSTQTKDLENVASPSPTASDSGKPAPKAKNSVYTDKYGQEVSVAYKKTVFEERSQWMHCWATLLAHCAGCRGEHRDLGAPAPSLR